MMFREPLAAQIIRGEKTMTTRALSDNPRSPWYRNRGPAYEGRPATWRYPVGKVFTINPGRGVARVAECEVTMRFRAVIGNQFQHRWKEEGFESKVAFEEVWGKIHPGFLPNEAVDVIGFKLVGSDCMGCDGCGWCEGSPAWTCTDCFGTGVDVSPAARALIRKVEAER